MKQKIQVAAPFENFKKIKGLFSKNRVEFDLLQCNCKNMDFLKTNHNVTIIYPNKIFKECVECVEKAKVNSNIFVLSDSLNIQEMIDFICAGARDCFTKETYYLIERATRKISMDAVY